MTIPAASRSPTFAETVALIMRQRLSTLHVSLPGKVVSYDAGKRTASIQPMLKQQIFNADGEDETQDYPILVNVPVHFPASGDWFVLFPVVPGNTGMLIFAERSLDDWLVSANAAPVDPRHVRMHDLSDAVFHPGVTVDAQVIPDVGNDHMVLGNRTGAQIHLRADGTVKLADDAATEFVALATKVNNELLALRDVINLWTPVSGDGGLALKALLTLFFTAGPPPLPLSHPLPWPQQVASAKVKSL